jgi:hypothetical protein
MKTTELYSADHNNVPMSDSSDDVVPMSTSSEDDIVPMSSSSGGSSSASDEIPNSSSSSTNGTAESMDAESRGLKRPNGAANDDDDATTAATGAKGPRPFAVAKKHREETDQARREALIEKSTRKQWNALLKVPKDAGKPFEKVSQQRLFEEVRDRCHLTVEDVLEVRKLAQGDLLIGVNSVENRLKVLKLTELAKQAVQGDIPRGEKPKTEVLGMIKGVRGWKAEEIKAELNKCDMGVLDVVPKSIYGSFLVTFAPEKPRPTAIYLGRRHEVEDYIDAPLRCRKCCGFFHRASQCNAVEITCLRCGQKGHKAKECQADRQCANCHGSHRTGDRACRSRRHAEAVVGVMHKQKVTFQEAKKQVRESGEFSSTQPPGWGTVGRGGKTIPPVNSAATGSNAVALGVGGSSQPVVGLLPMNQTPTATAGSSRGETNRNSQNGEKTITIPVAQWQQTLQKLADTEQLNREMRAELATVKAALDDNTKQLDENTKALNRSSRALEVLETKLKVKAPVTEQTPEGRASRSTSVTPTPVLATSEKQRVPSPSPTGRSSGNSGSPGHQTKKQKQAEQRKLQQQQQQQQGRQQQQPGTARPNQSPATTKNNGGGKGQGETKG